MNNLKNKKKKKTRNKKGEDWLPTVKQALRHGYKQGKGQDRERESLLAGERERHAYMAG